MAPALATLHLFDVTPARVPAAAARMALDRRLLTRTPGLTFWKLLGTGAGRTFTVADADPRRWGLFGVWASPDDLVRFEQRSPVAAAWRRLADDRWRADLRPLRARGSWGGRQPFAPAPPPRWAGPVAAVTRARLRLGRMRTFWAAVPEVSADLAAVDGCRFALGIGEAPLGLQGTFSVWDSADAMTDYAYRRGPHRGAIDRTAATGWYAEELFARFGLLQATGTLRGGDPLAPGPTGGR
jgi:hypothetical protein